MLATVGAGHAAGAADEAGARQRPVAHLMPRQL